MQQKDLVAVSHICMKAFKHSVADTLPPNGVKTFAGITTAKAFAERMQLDNLMFVAEVDGIVAGVLELKEKRHVAMFFIDPAYQRQGVGKRLLARALAYADVRRVTVKASLPSVSAYQRFGFIQDGAVGESGGLVFQPMVLDLTIRKI